MLIVEIHATSHVGRVRQGNEDNYLVLNISASQNWTSEQSAGASPVIQSQTIEVNEDGIILAVSDGMGGALAGEIASKLAVETVGQQVAEIDPEITIAPDHQKDLLIKNLYKATIFANHLIHRQSYDSQYRGMGATFTSVAITKQFADFLQVGDSRAYVIRNSTIKQVTKDQSLVQQLVDSNQILAEDAESHPMKNVILQALGAQPEVYPVPSRYAPQRGDVILLCSDGLSNELRAGDMLAIVMQNFDNLQTACETLVQKANEQGGKDNITVILARLDGDDLPSPTGSEVQVVTLSFADTDDDFDTLENTLEEDETF